MSDNDAVIESVSGVLPMRNMGSNTKEKKRVNSFQ